MRLENRGSNSVPQYDGKTAEPLLATLGSRNFEINESRLPWYNCRKRADPINIKYDSNAMLALKFAISVLRIRGSEHCTSTSNANLSFWLIHAMKNLDGSLRTEEWRLEWEQVLAANLLAWVTYSTYVEEAQTSRLFQISFAAISFSLNFCLPFPDLVAVQSHDWEVYAPFVLDCANAWIIRNGEIVPRWTTFAQRVRYFDQFRGTDKNEVWFSSNLEAANSTLGNLMEVSLFWVYRLARQEASGNFAREKVGEVIQYIRSELGDSGLHTALSNLYQSSQGPKTNHTTVEGQLITRLFHRLRCVLFLHGILSADSISDGVRDRDVLFIAQKITYFCWRQVIRRSGPLEDYFKQSWHNFSYLMVGGIGLTDECPEKSTIPAMLISHI